MAQGDWQGLITTTIPQYIRGVADRNIFRNRKTWALLRQKGRIMMDGSGRYQEWRVEYKINALRPFGAETNLVYPRTNRYFIAQLDWRGYAGTDAMGLMEKAQNKGNEAIIPVFAEKAERLMEGLTLHLADELYVDGTTAENALRFHGINSFLGYTIDSATYSMDGVNQHRPTAIPASVYAGKSCVPGALGGSWTGVWPDGRGDTEYDAWSPIITHYGSDFFGATPTFEANGHAALNYHIIQSFRNNVGVGLEGQSNVDLITMTPRMFFRWVHQRETQERLTVYNQKGSLLQQLGFNDVVNYMGAEVTFEYANPENEFYSWGFDASRVTSLLPQLFTPYGPFNDPSSLGDMWAVVILGNMRCNPRGFGKGVAA